MLRTASSFRAALAAAFVLVATVLPTGSARAQTATLNFNSITVDTTQSFTEVPNSYTEAGYVVTAMGGGVLPTDTLVFAKFGPAAGTLAQGGSYSGTSALFLNTGTTATNVDFARQGGGSFSFQSIQLSPFLLGNTSNVTFTGFLSAGGTVTQTLSSILGTNAEPQTFSFANFTNLTLLQMNGFDQYNTPVQFGNVTFGPSGTSTVPEPGSLGLLATGMLGLVGVARRHRSTV